MAHIISFPPSTGVVPSVEPRPTPPEDRQNIQTSPRQFGAQVGQAEEAVGQGLEKTGQFFGQIAADEQSNKWQKEADDLLYGTGQIGADGKPDLGFIGLTGEDALRARPQFEQQIGALREKYAGGLLTGQSQLQFENFTRRYQSLLMSKVGAHTEQQAKIYGISVNDGALANGDRTIANNYNDDEHFKHSMEDQRLAAGKKAELQGADKAGAIAEADSRSVAARLNGALAQHDLAAADQIFKQYGGLLDDKVRPAYETHIRGGRDGAVGDDILATARRAAGNPASLSGDLWSRIKGAEGGIGPNGEALVSPKGAIGVSQIIPSTAKEMAGDLGLPYDERRLHTDQAYNEQLGRGYLDKMLARYDGNEALAAAAYNAGPDRVDGWLGTIGDPRTGGITDADFAGKIPIAETRGYVQKIIAGTPREGVGGGAQTLAAAGTPGKFDMAAGDSIGVGHIRAAGLGGVAVNDVKMPEAALADAAGSRNPQQGLDFINAHPERFQGKSVLWSSGLMNARAALAANPAAVFATVGDQLDALKKAGAMPVLAGVDQGTFSVYNDDLKRIADQHQVPFAGPLPTKDVHPGPQGYKDYAASAAKLLPAASLAAPQDQIEGQPTSPAGLRAAASAIPIPAPPGSLSTPPALPPPGMQDLANAEAELAQRHAATIAAIGADPRGQANPTAAAHAMQKADIDFRSRQMALSAQKQAITEARNAALDDYVKVLRPGVPLDAALPERIANDPKLDAASRENLYRLIETRTRSTAEHDVATYGPRYFDVLRRVAAADADPDRIRDPSQLLQLTLPKDDGSQDLTTAGYEKLRQEMAQRRTPEGVGDAEIRKGAMAYAKHQLSFEMDYGSFKLRDPKGEDRFNIGFLPAFYRYYEAGIAAGKSPGELVAQDKLETLVKPFRRSDAELARDQLTAGVEAGAGSPAGAAAPDLTTQAGIVAAYRANKLSRQQAEEALIRGGFAAADAPPVPPPAPALHPPIPLR